MRKKLMIVLAVTQVFLLLAGCNSPTVTTLNPERYPDPPEEERYEALPIYIAWDMMGGETWTYEISPDGILEEGSQPPKQPEPETGEEILDEDYDPPGGRSVWFVGVSPGDAVVMFTTKSDKDEVVNIRQCAVRVYDDLTLALLHDEVDNSRN
jgi:hypothetical protein